MLQFENSLVQCLGARSAGKVLVLVTLIQLRHKLTGYTQ